MSRKKLSSLFTPAQFTPLTAGRTDRPPFLTAADKAQLCADLVHFVRCDFSRLLFTKRIYKNLSSMFGHIAHCNIDGFYEEWFATPTDRARWISHVLNSPSYGSPEYTRCDCERAFRDWLRTHALSLTEVV